MTERIDTWDRELSGKLDHINMLLDNVSTEPARSILLRIKAELEAAIEGSDE